MLNYVEIFNDLKSKREDLHFLKPNLEKILTKLTLSESVIIAEKSLFLLKQSFSLDDPYDRYSCKVKDPKGIILIHALYDAAIDLLIENTDIYKPF